MMGFIKGLFSESAAKVTDSIAKGLDGLFTSDEERLKARAIIEKQVQDYNLQLIDRLNVELAEVTKRHQADMTSDSWLSKNIRPLSLVFILGMYSILSISDGAFAGFEMNEQFVELLGNWGMVVMSFYFGGRSFEKITQIVRRKDENS